MEGIKISQVEEHQVEEIQHYVMGFRKALFPMLDNSVWPKDITHFKESYLDAEIGAFLQARSLGGRLLGVIGMLPYDHRFAYLDYSGNSTVEIVRLYVEPAYRRLGLGGLLFQHLFALAQERAVEMMYLHTHPFLTGALAFWECQGFDLVYSSVEGGETTWHMQRRVHKPI